MAGQAKNAAAMTVVAILLCAQGTEAISCKGKDGSTVDWWAIFKMPDGLNYAYQDSNSANTEALTLEDDTLDADSCPLFKTFDQVSDDSDDYVLYNDEFPAKYQPKYHGGPGAHAKGVIATSTSSGFWLVHSVPKFPDFTADDYGWSEASTTYGQSFLCMSLSKGDIDAAAKQVTLMHPHVYVSNLPNSDAALSNMDQESYSGSGNQQASLSAGTTMLSFAKSPDWGQDLYEDFVEAYYRVSEGFAWETWRRSPAMDSFCPPDHKYPSVNVQTVQFGDTEFKYTKDHSKYGLSQSGSSPIVCIGGTNRMTSQEERGGGTVCFTDNNLWSALTANFQTKDSCSSGGVSAAAPIETNTNSNGDSNSNGYGDGYDHGYDYDNYDYQAEHNKHQAKLIGGAVAGSCVFVVAVAVAIVVYRRHINLQQQLPHQEEDSLSLL